MEGIVEYLWRISWQAALIAGPVWVVCRVAGRAPAAWRCALWLIVLVKFWVPPFLYLPSGLAFWETRQHTPVRASGASILVPASTAPGPELPVPELSAATGRVTSSGGRTEEPSTREIIAAAWLAGVCVTCAVLGLRIRRQRRLVRESVAADRHLADLLGECACRLRLCRLPEIKFSEQASTPMLVNLFRPAILLPRTITESCTRAELSVMLMHELAHIRRRDIAAVWLHRFVQVFFYFHPAVWLAGRELARERELACDELVLSTSGVSRQEYAAGYLAALKLASAASRPAAALAMAEPLDLEKRRLARILHEPLRTISARWIGALLLVTALGLPTFAGVRAKAPPVVAAVGLPTFTAAGAKALPKARPASAEQDLLQAAIAGSTRAASAIRSGKGRVTVREWSQREGGRIFEVLTEYDLAFVGDRYRLSIETTVLRNDPVPTVKGIWWRLGHKSRREVALSGSRIIEFVEGRGGGQAAIGHGQVVPTERGFLKADGLMAPYTRHIKLTGGVSGNGIVDIAGLAFERNSDAKRVTTKLAGREVVNGSECVIVEKRAIFSSKVYPDLILRMWVDPQKGYTIPKLRWYKEGGALTGRTLYAEADVELREYASGIWGPHEVVRNYYRRSAKGKRYKQRCVVISYGRRFRINPDVSEQELSLVLPPGTRVYDEDSDSYYAVPDEAQATPGDGRSDSAELLAGLTAVEGPGVLVTLRHAPVPEEIESPELAEEYSIHDHDIRNFVNELTLAGAEAIAVNDQRVVANTRIRSVGQAIQVNNVPVAAPFVITAIGPPRVLRDSLTIQGSIVDRFGGTLGPDVVKQMVQLEKKQSVTIPAYSGGRELKWAKPLRTPGDGAAPPG